MYVTDPGACCAGWIIRNSLIEIRSQHRASSADTRDEPALITRKVIKRLCARDKEFFSSTSGICLTKSVIRNLCMIFDSESLCVDLRN